MTDYTTVTEMPGNLVTKQAIEMIQTRYSVALRYCEGKNVLEVGCGAGQGLGLMASSASRIVGGDFTGSIAIAADKHYRGRVPIVQLDAHSLPFCDHSFDTIVLFEAIYYLERPDLFLQECRRVSGPGGVLVLCSANKEYADFNPSPRSTSYLSAPEMFNLLTSNNYETQMYGAFPSQSGSVSDRAVSSIKRAAVKMHLVPQSMKGKEWLKRVFYGNLVPLPAELEGTAEQEARLVPISADGPSSGYKVLFAIGHLR